MSLNLPVLRTLEASTHSKLEDLFYQIRSGCDSETGRLYNQLLPVMRMFLRRRIGWHYEDALQESFLSLLDEIRSGALHNPSELIEHLCTIMSRNCQMAYRNERKVGPTRSNSKVGAIDSEGALSAQFQRAREIQCMTDALDRLPIQMRNVIEKCFLEEKSNELVRKELGLSETQFRLLKSRAKLRLAEEVRRIQSLQSLKNSVSSEHCIHITKMATVK